MACIDHSVAPAFCDHEFDRRQSTPGDGGACRHPHLDGAFEMIANAFPLLVIGSMTLFLFVLGTIAIEDAIRNAD